MTKVEMQFHLQKPLDERMMARLADLPTLYGILRIKLHPGLDGLAVEFDATRLKEPDVEAALARAGIPVQPAT